MQTLRGEGEQSVLGNFRFEYELRDRVRERLFNSTLQASHCHNTHFIP